MTAIYDRALELVNRAGVFVYPTTADQPKVPIKGSRGYQDGSPFEVHVDEWFDGTDNNLAICLPYSGLVVVDIDRNHANGADGFKSLKKAGIELPETYTEITPKGGMHYFYKRPALIYISNTIGLLKGVDIITTGVPVAPSNDPQNGPYKHVRGVLDAMIPELPETLLKVFLEHNLEKQTSKKGGADH